jgi:YggT family protein
VAAAQGFCQAEPNSLDWLARAIHARYTKAPTDGTAAVLLAIRDILLIVIDIYIWVLIAAAVLSWLIAFNVVNTRNRFVYTLGDFLYRITEPVLRPLRSVIPNLGGIDITPVVAILILIFLQRLIFYNL